MARIALFLFVATLGAIGVLYALDIGIPIDEDMAIRRELRLSATGEDMDKRVSEALEQGDVGDAEMYAEIAAYIGRPLSEETRARLDRATSTAATVARGTGEFVTGFATGEGATTAELAGAVTSDLTVVGDVRDIAGEGAKLVAGEEYSELILGLSVVGLAATAATVATGGGGVVAKLGVSLVKVAHRAGTLTADFARTLTRLSREAVNMDDLGRTLRATDLTNLKATEEAVAGVARNIGDAKIFPVVADLGQLARNAGPGETVKLMRYVRTTEDLQDVTAMSAKLGTKTRGVMEITGKASLRAFKTSLNIIEFLIEQILAFLAWLLGLLGLGAGKRILRGRAR